LDAWFLYAYANVVIVNTVQGYNVYYTLNAEQPMSTWSALRVDNGQLTTVGSLLTNETYTIAVAAFTDIGEGPASEPMHVRTQLGGQLLNWNIFFVINPVLIHMLDNSLLRY